MNKMMKTLGVWWIGVWFTAGAWGQSAKEVSPEQQAKYWATACTACHGHNGRAEGVGFLIGGRPTSELYDQLIAFKSGKRAGTVMMHLVKAFSAEELKLIAQEISALK